MLREPRIHRCNLGCVKLSTHHGQPKQETQFVWSFGAVLYIDRAVGPVRRATLADHPKPCRPIPSLPMGQNFPFQPESVPGASGKQAHLGANTNLDGKPTNATGKCQTDTMTETVIMADSEKLQREPCKSTLQILCFRQRMLGQQDFHTRALNTMLRAGKTTRLPQGRVGNKLG